VNAFKTIYIQLFKEQNKVIETRKNIKGDRGTIFDRNNQRLAYDIDFYDIYIEELSQDDVSVVEYFMSEYLDKDILNLDSLVLAMSKNKRKILLEGVPYHTIERLDEALKEYPQIKTSLKYKGRYYPKKGLASQLIGRFSHKNDTIGGWGIERVGNYSLKAQSDSLNYLITSRGRNRKNYSNDEYLKLSGQDIKLTIDIDYQRILEAELMSQLKVTNSESANGLIVDPYSGEILALASVPTSDLNEKLLNIELTKDYVCQFEYEPGSTLKPFSILSGISNNIIDLSDEYYCEQGRYNIPHLSRPPVIDHEPHDTLSVKEILAYSSNIGLVKISSDIGDEIYNTFKSFGFGQKTGINSYYESSGSMLDNWDAHDLIALPIGQGLRVTNLQIAMAYSAIANGGYLLEPKIIIENSEKNYPKVIRKIADKKDLELLIESLKMVVTDGTAASVMQSSPICSYGKTGTAQVWDSQISKYSDSIFIASYVGVFPCDEPKLVCVVSFIGPDEEKKWASKSAVPAFSEILNRIVNKDRNLAIQIADEVR